ncbi:cytochrome P450 [Lactifluus subvellereus]|nr:cytochrome P450 [Lactifluus subvellereus]
MPSLLSIIDLLVLLSFLFAFRAIRDYRRRGRLPYPPGPRPLPLIGNLFHIPTESSWLAYTRFSKKYGDVLSFHVFGRVIVVLSSAKATKDLLEKRGHIYSGRPMIPFYDMMEWDWFLPAAGYTERWHQGRKVLDRGLRSGAAALYRPMQQAKTRVLLTRLLESPSEWEAHVQLLPGDLILTMTYGYEARGLDDRRVAVARKMAEHGSTTALPDALLVNDFPFLRHIPEWLPWFSYKPLARFGHDLGDEVLNEPIRFVRDSMVKGTARPSLALENLGQTEELSGPERERAKETIIGALGSIYAAGSDTAQGELDAITGRGRLPTFEDRSRLPLVDAICKEVLRWQPVTPLGAVVIGNIWWAVFSMSSRAIMRDPAVYPEPDVFKPERYLSPDGTLLDDPILTTVFGYGKRICPGRHFVDATLFIVVASLLSVFNIEKVPDPESRPLVYSYTGSIIRCSTPTIPIERS